MSIFRSALLLVYGKKGLYFNNCKRPARIQRIATLQS